MSPSKRRRGSSHAVLALLASFASVEACGGREESLPVPAEEAEISTPPPGEAQPFVRFVQDDQPVTRAQIGVPVTVRVEGVPRGASVTLRAAMRTKDQAYASWATFKADERGRVDTQTQAPLEGTWANADADGIFWSMTKVARAPTDLDRFDVRVLAEVAGQAVATETLVRFFAAENVRRTFVSSPVHGVLYAPPDGAARGAILVLGGDAQALADAESLAAWWATRGYAALAITYYGEGALPTWRREVPLEYFAKAIDWLGARPEVSGKKLVAMGASRGGELALLLGATFPSVRAVVAEAPSGLAWGAADAGAETATWTFEGKPIAWVPRSSAPPKVSVGSDGEPVYRYAPVYAASVAEAQPGALALAEIRVERTLGPVLLLAGDDDGFWPSCDLTKVAYARLSSAAHLGSYGDTMICYPGAGHVLGLPGMPTTDLSVMYDLSRREWLSLGGTPEGTARAQRDIYRRVTTFVDDATR